ncbi:MAG: hypothetical protein PF692_10870 [Kiritimatiellae bacterium]|nr:hypothetical protein [Kiritimatiellia bacterium]
MDDNWSFIENAPPKLDVETNPLPYNNDLWQHPVEEPFLCINSPQFFSFEVKEEFISFVWRGGRISGEYNDPIGVVHWDNAPEFEKIEISNLFNGDILDIYPEIENGNVVLSDIPVGSIPIVIRWIPKA